MRVLAARMRINTSGVIMKQSTKTKSIAHSAKKSRTFIVSSALTSLLLLSCAFQINASQTEKTDKAAPISNAKEQLRGVAHPHFQAEDIFELEYASDPQVSPNGKDIVYVRAALQRHHERQHPL